MDSTNIYYELIDLADKEQLKIEQSLPEDVMICRGLLVETVRVLDFISLGQPGVPQADKISFSVFDLNMIEMGWNLAAAMLLKSGDHRGFPMMQSTIETRKQIVSILYQLGIIVQLRRTVEMVKSGLVSAQKEGSTFTFSHTSAAKDQFLDELEHGALDELEEKLKSSGSKYKNWELVEYNAMREASRQVGNFMSVKYKSDFASFKLEDIDSQMIPLIKQWDTGNHGIMMGYDSNPEIDNHFLAIATELTSEWRDEAGIHPTTKIGKVFALDVMTVAMMVISFHIKHIHFAQLASEKDKKINIPQSLSIWTPLHELIKDISDFSGIDRGIVKEALHVITLCPEDAYFLRKYTSRFRPLLIDIGSGFVFRPASCILRNPLHSVYAMVENRDPSLTNSISQSREDWIRNNLYAIFAGSRYQRVEGNIKIRLGGNIITDIDAAIYDNLTGELALIQIKWQNYFTNDVKKLRSKAKNFVSEISRWTEKVENWIDSQEVSQIVKSLKLKDATNNLTKEKIFLFGLSKNAARMQGYGYELNNDQIAIGTWAQFRRNRTEIGPASLVVSKLFQNLKKEEHAKVECRPLPIKVPFADMILDFKDIWCISGEDNESNIN